MGAEANGYLFGTIRGAFLGCGWVQSNLLAKPPYANDGTSNCVNQGVTGPPLASIAVGVNPRPFDGSGVQIKKNQVNGVKFCAYITPAPDTICKRHECGAAYKKVSFSQVSDGYSVLWRYVIRGRGWVVVRDPHPAAGQAPNSGTATVNWWFVRRSAFAELCKRASVTPSLQACEPTN